ncbi:hypothetical protein GCM10023085_24750 [Actinomadura viridis]|uniref:Uncharacterized protein n=1 Tax=Actinomadura viridis TaxID=58110 RepID=A0A931GIQ6_9ACTN|nr:hypothetical protein [Actinomadura viridis]MBG6088848.1 hypothetical protein [Actinomadura viridis]
MTDLYTVSVDTVEGATLRGRVHIINPDAPYVPEGRTFPVGLIFETWFPADIEAPSRAEVGEEDPIVTAQRPQMEAMIRQRRTIRVNADGHLLSYDGRTLLEPRQHAGDVPGRRMGRDEISEYFTVAVDGLEEVFVRHASSIVASYKVSPLRNVPMASEVIQFNAGDPLTDEELAQEEFEEEEVDLHLDSMAWELICARPFDERPYADITFTVTDARYLKHLSPGLRWRTAVWR